VELHAAGVLAALAAVVFAAHCAARRGTLAVLLATFAIANVIFARLGFPEIGAFAFCVAAAQAAALVRPRWRVLPPVAAGLCAAAWVSILEAQGLPWPPAALAAGLALAAAVAAAARGAAFAPAEIRDEAFVLVGSFALLLAVGPEVFEGWRSAVALTAEPLPAESKSVGAWLGALVVGSVLLGGAYSLWKRR
jgi:hypothetical protein